MKYISESLEDFLHNPALLEKITYDSEGLPEDDEDYSENYEEDEESSEEELFNDYMDDIYTYIQEEMDLEPDEASNFFDLLNDKYSHKVHDLFDVDISPEDAANQLYQDEEIKNDL